MAIVFLIALAGIYIAIRSIKGLTKGKDEEGFYTYSGYSLIRD